MKKNKVIAGGLDELLNPTPNEEVKQGKVKGNYIVVAYNIPPETAEKIRQISYWDRKKLNAVVTEAFEQYAKRWKPKNEIPPTKI